MSKKPTCFKQTEIGELPEEWEVVKVQEACEDISAKVAKVKKREYQPKGKYPVIDQGAEFISGYTDCEEACKDLPVIVFGDHTRIFKFVDFPFVRGADGVKVLKPKSNFHPRFLFYALISLKIPTIGYQRHYSLLKEQFIPLPPLEEQRRIAGVLRLVDRVAEETRRIVSIYERAKKFALKRLLTRGIGHTRFKQTEIGELPEGWEVVRLGEVVDIYDNLRVPLSAKQRANMQGKYPYCGANGIVDYINDYIFDGEYVLLAEDGGYWGAFEASAYIMNGKFWVNNHAHVLQGKAGVLVNYFLMYTLNFMDLTGYVGGTTRGKLTQNEMKKILIPLPPLEEQKQIAEMLSTIDAAIENERRYLGILEKCKRWLLDNLLTGKIRLSPEVDEILKGVLPDAF